MENSLVSCPLCGTELSKTKFAEIQGKITQEEQLKLREQRKKVAEAETALRKSLEEEFKRELQAQRAAAAKLAKQDAELQLRNIAAERDQAVKKAKELEGREEAIRKQAEREKDAATKLAKKEADEKIKVIAAERDQAAKKLKESEARQVEIRKEVQDDAEKKRQKELSDQRAALEKDKATGLLRQQAEFNREREALQKRVKVVEQQLQKKTANELGDGGEIDVFEALREEFPRDLITRIKKGQPGADVLFEVLHKGQSCGRIVIDSKIRQAWQNGFVTKLRQDQVEAGAEHAILATTVFPAGKKEMCIESDVIVVNPARVVQIARILRQAMVMVHIKGLSMKQRAGKMNSLYKLITSEGYGRKFSEAGKLTQEILEVDVQEKKAHDNVWKKRGALATRASNLLREIETEVAAVIEADGDVDAQDGFGVQSAKMAG